jgi:RNA polymerase sigma-54 factor
MILEQSQQASHGQSINISAKLIASIKVLQYSAEELDQAIAQEMGENPALEVEEVTQCPRCGATLHVGLCPNCERTGSQTVNDGRYEVAGWDDYADLRGLAGSSSEDDSYNPLDFIRSGGTLQEHLMRQLGASLDDQDYPIAEYLIGSLDSHGYLTVTVADTAEVLRLPIERVERALAALQTLDPPGIGARDLAECLLIQLRAFEERDEAPPLVRPLLSRHLRDLGEHRFPEIARELGVTSGDVKRAWSFIRTNLNPFPAHAFESGDVPGLRLASNSERSTIVRPDVIIRRTENGFEAEVVEERRYTLGIHSVYADLYRHARSQKPSVPLGETERAHIREHVTRTRFFIECLKQRWETLSTISNALIEFQRDFLEKGVRHLRPLTRGELAAHVGLHESTVSRATANKYVLLPEGRTIPFDDFFDASLAAKDILRELIDAENPAKPLSDEDLAELLNERGVPLARRTVAKYREALGILPSRLRF